MTAAEAARAGLALRALVAAARPAAHRAITTFAALRDDVYADLTNLDKVWRSTAYSSGRQPFGRSEPTPQLWGARGTCGPMPYLEIIMPYLLLFLARISLFLM